MNVFVGLAPELISASEWSRRVELLADGRTIHRARNLLAVMSMLEEGTRLERKNRWIKSEFEKYCEYQNRLREMLYEVRAKMALS